MDQNLLVKVPLPFSSKQRFKDGKQQKKRRIEGIRESKRSSRNVKLLCDVEIREKMQVNNYSKAFRIVTR